MTHVVRTRTAAKPALIIFGSDQSGRPHASWFSSDEVEDAERSSGETGYAVLRLTRDDDIALATKLPRGRICRNGRAHVPLLSSGLSDVLHRLTTGGGKALGRRDSDLTSKAPTAPASEEVKRKSSSMALVVVSETSNFAPQDWEEISNGSLVLAYDKSSKAWYEALVVNGLNDTFRLTWRDYPEEGIITRQRKQLALLPPNSN